MVFLQISSSLLFLLVILWVPPTRVNGVEFTVEESGDARQSQHKHRVRHHRGARGVPYKSAASLLQNPISSQMEAFSLNCPHVVDANNQQVRIEVTWTLNDTIWLKIEDGEKRIVNKLTTFSKRTVAGKTVLRVLLNNGRYFFDYDELTGDFSMEIRPVEVFEDVGVWQCHVTVHQRGNEHTLTSRSRVKIPRGHRAHESRPRIVNNPRDMYETFPAVKALLEMKRDEASRQLPAKISSFTRNDKEQVEINRDDHKRRATVVFDRQAPMTSSGHAPRMTSSSGGHAHRMTSQRHAQAAIDYEMSMADDSFYPPRSRARSTFYVENSQVNEASYLLSLILVFIIVIRNYCC